ncbi:MAG: phenylalanine--tRNA ligase subunit alpha [Candidatus Omnitrophota bacterium]
MPHKERKNGKKEISMEDKIKNLESAAKNDFAQAKSSEELEQLRIKYLGRKGMLVDIFGEMKNIPPQDRAKTGAALNRLKSDITRFFDEAKDNLGTKKAGPKRAAIDVTTPGIRRPLGRKHPLTQVLDEINDIFLQMGFKIAEGPEIETEYCNFEALNIPLDHPSRDAFDTFYIEGDVLLRSQTSTVQIRVMEKEKPPLQVIAPGKVYRPDATDASHSFMFHQVEGFMVDKDIKFSDLKGVLSLFAKQMFGADTKMRFRPHFFPFTEPSAEVDISCIICKGQGCRVCSQKGWLEILGAGMIHPRVFESVGYDPKKWRGFAFGMGVERIAMLKFGIDDIRLFFENDLRFLRQF